jgi:hypothetical protein
MGAGNQQFDGMSPRRPLWYTALSITLVTWAMHRSARGVFQETISEQGTGVFQETIPEQGRGGRRVHRDRVCCLCQVSVLLLRLLFVKLCLCSCVISQASYTSARRVWGQVEEGS